MGGYSPEVQVGIARGWVQPILGQIAVHVFRGCLGQELVQALTGVGGEKVGGRDMSQSAPVSKHPSLLSRPPSIHPAPPSLHQRTPIL